MQEKGGRLTAIDGRARVHASTHPELRGDGWRRTTRRAVQAIIDDFVTMRCGPELHTAGVGIASEVLRDFVAGGKCVRSTFMYLGWLCGADDDEAALRAAASLELLHAFALLQDDVMDGSALRRGRPSGHVTFARWHRHLGLSGSPGRSMPARWAPSAGARSIACRTRPGIAAIRWASRCSGSRVSCGS
jgi:geranylgeranyl diphosphate synthase type I